MNSFYTAVMTRIGTPKFRKEIEQLVVEYAEEPKKSALSIDKLLNTPLVVPSICSLRWLIFPSELMAVLSCELRALHLSP